MVKLLIKNGLVFDPINEIKGETKDILVEEGKIVEKLSSNDQVKEIDASGKTVIPAALDIHTHVSSTKLNWVRLLGNKNEDFKKSWNRLSLYQIAKDYIRNGYTFICEANILPSLAKQTLFDFSNIPVLDTAFLLNISNLWPLESEFQDFNPKTATAFISDLLSKTKAFGIKIYNPFESESWNINYLRDNIKQKGKLYDFTPLDVYTTLTEINENLRLPHSVQAHIEGYESEIGLNNLRILLDTIQELDLIREKSSKLEREQIFHLAHANSYTINGDNSEVIQFFNQNQKFDLDLAFVGFDEINPVITSDRRLITNLQDEYDYKTITTAMEFEGDSFASLRKFSKANQIHFNIWANAIEMALEIKNKWQIQFSLNYPHYSHLDNIPYFSTLLLSDKARKKELESFDNGFNHKLRNNEKTLSFYEYVIITRASPAKSLGIGSIKGNLGLGADADINILDIDINEIDIDKEHSKILKSFENIDYVIKEGNIIKKHGDFYLDLDGKIFWTEGTFDEEKDAYLKKKKEFYQKYYSIFYESLNYEIDKKTLRKIP